ncbi:MAG: zinc-ribbon domain-containing protein [Planctomycetota bacterium]
MLIQCTSCGTQAKIPESKEGSKVRCPNCGHVYVARPLGAGRGARAKKEDPTKYVIIGGAVLAGIIVTVIATRGGDEPTYATPKEEVAEVDDTPYIDPMGWDAPVVKLARDMHKAAYQGDDTKLLIKLEGGPAYAYELEKAIADKALVDDMDKPLQAVVDQTTALVETLSARPGWETLDEAAQLTYKNERVAAAMAAGIDGAVTGWKPFDGMVESIELGKAVVRLRVQARDVDAGLEDRWTQWVFVNLDGDGGGDERWRWIDADRYLTKEELAAMRRKRYKKTEKKTLSDGSIVYEGIIRAIPYDDEVPTEMREKITALVDEFVADLDAPPRVRTRISNELVDIGKPAIAGLLTKIALIMENVSDDVTENVDEVNQIFFIHNVLRDITGIETTFDVSIEMGATKERIESGIKQWFGWYDRNYRKFDGLADEGDPLADDPDFQPQTAEELRKYNRELRKQLEEEKARKDG